MLKCCMRIYVSERLQCTHAVEAGGQHPQLLSPECKCLWKPAEGVRSPGAIITDFCELPCGYWELNPALPREQPELNH